MRTLRHRLTRNISELVLVSLSFLVAGIASPPGLAIAQISPAEITSPDLKALEQKYFAQLKSLNQAIAHGKFPFAFALNRFAGSEPGKDAESDSRGIEFVRFHERTVLKITGNYSAAYNSDLLTDNERAGKTFSDVIEPILALVEEQIPPDATCDAIGFEISYHARIPNKNFDYEGREILVAVFSVPDALRFAQVSSIEERQEILNRSEIFVNGKAFGMDLGRRDPLVLESKDAAIELKTQIPSAGSASTGARQLATGRAAPGGDAGAQAGVSTRIIGPPLAAIAPPVPIPTQEDADHLQSKYQSQLDALAKEGATTFHFVDYDPPSFAIFQKQIALQMTLRNPARYDREKTSIYKRAAQSFDLFLAPLLKTLLDKMPEDEEFSVIDCGVLNQLSADPKTSGEAVEFVMPRKALAQFVDAEITNQQLLDQSVVLVNGVRIALNLQIVE